MEPGDNTDCGCLCVNPEEAKEAIRIKLYAYPELQDEYNFAIRQWAIDVSEANEKTETQKKRADDYARLLDEKTDAPEFYETVWFGIGLGIAVTLVGVVAVHSAMEGE